LAQAILSQGSRLKISRSSLNKIIKRNMNLLHHIVFSTSVMVQPWGLRIQPQEAKCNPTQGTWHHMADPEPTLPPWGQYEWLPQGECEMTRMSLDRFCDFMEKKKLDHIMFVGDSLSAMMASNFISLTGVEVHINEKGFFKKIPEASFGRAVAESNVTETEYDDASFDEQQFSCRGNPITFTYHRNDKIDPSTKKFEKCGRKNVIHGGATLCSPWWEEYLSNAKTTLLVANTGVHHHSEDSFKKSFDLFFHEISKVDAGMVVFRLSAPGHANCRIDSTPFQNEREFEVSSIYSWDLVRDFNKHAKEKFQELQNPKFKILDVYGMSVLRPDGHRKPPHDCLHYKSPGLPDWWNHLLMTELDHE